MQVVIEISKSNYKEMCEHGTDKVDFDIQSMMKNGVVLPENHGRLIDANELKTAFPTCDNSLDIKVASVRAAINHVPTIIEADKESKE